MIPSRVFITLRLLPISCIFLSGVLLGCKNNFLGNRASEQAIIPLAELPVPGITIRGGPGIGQPLPPGRAANPALRPITNMATAVYGIKKGDTLWSIARSHRTSVLTLQRLNGISDSFIRYGDGLKVPAAGAALLAKEQKERPVVKEPALLPAPLPLPVPVPVPVPVVKEPAPLPVPLPGPLAVPGLEPAPAVKEPGAGLGLGGGSEPRPKPPLQVDEDGFLPLPPQP
jgi:hypothetical protein